MSGDVLGSEFIIVSPIQMSVKMSKINYFKWGILVDLRNLMKDANTFICNLVHRELP